MHRFAMFLFALCLALPAAAERKQTFDDLEVHYSAYKSSFLQPEIAAAAGLTRSEGLGVFNVSVLKDGKAQLATVKARIENLMGQQRSLSFREVRQGDAIYYLSQFPFGEEKLHFTVDVKSGGRLHTFEFDQEFFPDK